MRDFGKEIGIKDNMEIHLSNFWLNLNSNGDSNRLHTHPHSFFSACYYVQAPENCGKIEFENPSNMINFWWQSFTDTNTYTTFSNVSVDPAQGKLIIFPSWLKHHVYNNNSNKLRISLAFNSDISFVE
jgi:uncharacterized protein (TIGR02466 family)